MLTPVDCQGTVDTGIFSAVLYHLSYLGRDAAINVNAAHRGCQGTDREGAVDYAFKGPALDHSATNYSPGRDPKLPRRHAYEHGKDEWAGYAPGGR